ncbi:isoaspartyl peptidase/L-asparaginase family protein [Oscillatoria sp. CS-180]|uniref:isoaspartyl peptidase/L-asparaginase family protein n=1 Tax=Oscillatoria sp. CS-180 TaxID=3021720 RepID=UPI00232CAA96|nr:isoaspartyl peptidase/L-asparaginase family protein [Oscillatoria sp. CS-180]MDB9524551.1 isoaspartyl peptidase/L-asparaginase family protein [Oscillatoria sp. CS-180]
MISDNFSLMIHGGAGALQHIRREGNESDFMQSMQRILEGGRQVLVSGGTALDAVEYCAVHLEDDPLYNAGRGSVLNEYGEVEMDAAIMDGQGLEAGAVAGITNVKNPIALARRVLEKSEHVMLIGKGAREFANLHNVEIMTDNYFVIDSRIRQWREAQKAGGMMLDHEDVTPQHKLGTIGAVARDGNGNLAAATSTGGIVNKRWGRVGDSPIVGAGVFADNETCAVSATGYGEQFQRTVLSKMVSDFVHFKGMDAQAAATAGINYLVDKVNGLGGVIVIDRNGHCGVGHSTSGMIYGAIELGGESLCHLA